jgi:16S rRNA (cytosine967-C5)-methyltransferase
MEQRAAELSKRPAPKASPEKLPAGFAARRAAFRLLQSVLWQDRPLQDALGHALQGLDNPSDRGLAHGIALGTLRWLTDLDGLIDSATKNKLADDARARLVLRMALIQVLVLKTPPHAVIATNLPLLEGGPRRLVHGVLSRLLREEVSLPGVATLPAPFDTRWPAGVARALAVEPPLDLALKDAAATADWAEKLGGESWFPGHVRLLASKGSIDVLEGFADGAWWVQDVAAQLPARLLHAKPGDTVVDACAAPGGKTLQLASGGAQVTALDISERRLERVGENLARTDLKAHIIVADALTWMPDAAVDAVLLDAPCSATGTVRRHPDVMVRKASRDLSGVITLQRHLLTRAASWLKPGGRLLYAVCSLEPEEGAGQLAWVQQNLTGLQHDPVQASELGALADLLSPDGSVRTWPHSHLDRGGMDGFFMARFINRQTRPA